MLSSSQASQIQYIVFVSLLLVSKFKGKEVQMIPDNSSLYAVEPFTSLSRQDVKYDVFVSFRGTDIRQGFLSHLIKALSQKQIFAFVDDKLHRGDEISQALHGAIQRSLISLVIFSQDYASSRWCLDELVKIVKCREKDGQTIIPVFNKIDPSDVRHQKGTYANAFAEHEKKYPKNKVQAWRTALRDSAHLSGFHSSNFRNDAELIEEIVKFVVMRLKDMHQVKSKGFIGIGKSIARLESLLHQDSKDVRVIGIWGMGGIGKTTLAEEVYNRLCPEYESCCFLANVREESGRHGIISLKEKLFSTLLNEDWKIGTPRRFPSYVEKRLGRMKVLIVLDDVDDSDKLETLIGSHDWFGSDSRIIVTTRDKQVLAEEVDDIYEVEALDCDESLELFIFNALKQKDFDMEYCELSRKVVHYAKGIPLVVKVLAQLLRGKDKDIWQSHLEKLKRMPDKKVHKIMRLSYDDLDREERKIFLDIACFFNGLNLGLEYIKDLLKGGDDYSVAAELERLKDKALITISQHNVVSVHHILQEMAWEIVREESMEYPKSHHRLRDPYEIYQVLESNKGSEAIRSIAFNFSAIKDLELSPQVFTKMSNLHFLNFHSAKYREGLYIPDGLQSLPNELMHLPLGLESLPNELRYLSWMYYPLPSLPPNFSAEKLVILDLQYNRLQTFWHGVQNLVNLKIIALRNSLHLTKLPDLSKARNLKVLDLRQSVTLACVPPSLFCLNKLEILDLGGCWSLSCLQSNIHLTSLRYLSLSGCVRLERFSVTSESMEELNLELTGIKELPSSFGRQGKLVILSLALSDIQSLPSTMKNLTRLQYLDMSYCWNLQTLPELPPSLEKLDASGCRSLKTVLFPSTVAPQMKEKRETVVFWNCFALDEHSLWAIGLNAYINMMTLAYQHLSAWSHDLYKDSDTQATYVYPGGRVPKWLTYRTKRNYKTIDLSSSAASYSPMFGFIFCFIVPRVPSAGFSLKFSISVGKGKGNSIDVYLHRPDDEIVSDHVCLMYNHRLSRYINNRISSENLQRFKIKVTAVSLIGKSEYVPVMLKGFGVSPISTSDYHSFIQQMELVDSNPQLQISHFHWKTRVHSSARNQNTSLEKVCFPHQKTSLDVIQQDDSGDDGCWKFKHHVFTTYTFRHLAS